MRVTDNVSLLMTLAHVSQKEGHVVIHTDSGAAIDSLQHSMPSDIVYYLTTAYQYHRGFLLREECHAGIIRNELADIYIHIQGHV